MEQFDRIEDLVEEYSRYLDEGIEDLECRDIRRGVLILNRAEELGYSLKYQGDTFTEDLQLIPGFVYAINSEGDICH